MRSVLCPIYIWYERRLAFAQFAVIVNDPKVHEMRLNYLNKN